MSKLLRDCLGIDLRREEAISALKELLDNCINLDGYYFELDPPSAFSSTKEGYQIIIKAPLDQETIKCTQEILMKQQLTYQIGSMWKTKRSTNKTNPDTIIIYKPNSDKN